VTDHFLELGGDSIHSIQVVARCNRLGFRLGVRDLLSGATVRDIAARAQGPVVAADRDGWFPLAPSQRRFFASQQKQPNLYAQGLALNVDRRVGAEQMRAALALLVDAHGLARRFRADADGGQQSVAAPDRDAELTWPTGHRDISTFAQHLFAELDLASGPTFAAGWWPASGDEDAVLLLVAHHLIVDVVSWRILRDDLEAVLRDIAADRKVELPVAPFFGDWAARLTDSQQLEVSARESSYWIEQCNPGDLVSTTSIAGGWRVGDMRSIQLALDREDTRRFLALEVAHPDGVIAAAVLRSIRRTGLATGLLLDMEWHGRSDDHATDFSRTVGWFTARFPVYIPVGDDAGCREDLESTQRIFGAVPRGGSGYGVLRYAGGDPALRERLACVDGASLGFNYLGVVDSGVTVGDLLQFAAWQPRVTRSPEEEVSNALRLEAWVGDGRLEFRLDYQRSVFAEDVIRTLSAALKEELQNLIRRAPEDPAKGTGYSARRLSRSELEGLANRLGQG
jgi:non-ribosomal peptide synthase protein (TIGR01720 family)